MNSLQSNRFDLIETPVTRQTMFGPMPCIIVNALMRDEPAPTLVAATVLFVRVKRSWLLSHLMVEPEGRRIGIATELVSFYETRLGHFGAAWVSDSGEAFGRKYVERFGPRPQWQVGKDEDVEAIIASAMASVGGAA